MKGKKSGDFQKISKVGIKLMGNAEKHGSVSGEIAKSRESEGALVAAENAFTATSVPATLPAKQSPHFHPRRRIHRVCSHRQRKEIGVITHQVLHVAEPLPGQGSKHPPNISSQMFEV